MAWAESSTAVTVRQYRGFRQDRLAYSRVGVSCQTVLPPVNTTQVLTLRLSEHLRLS